MVFLIYPWKIHLSLGQKSCNLTTRLLETLQSCPRLFAATTDSIEAFFARTYMKKRSPCLLLPLCRASKQAKYLMECRTSAAQSRNPTFIKWHPETMKSNLCLVIEKLLIVWYFHELTQAADWLNDWTRSKGLCSINKGKWNRDL